MSGQAARPGADHSPGAIKHALNTLGNRISLAIKDLTANAMEVEAAVHSEQDGRGDGGLRVKRSLAQLQGALGYYSETIGSFADDKDFIWSKPTMVATTQMSRRGEMFVVAGPAGMDMDQALALKTFYAEVQAFLRTFSSDIAAIARTADDLLVEIARGAP